MPSPPPEIAWSVRELPRGRDPIEVFARLRAGSFPWLLDSSLPSERLGRWSFAGADPAVVVRTFGERTRIDVRRVFGPYERESTTIVTGDPFEVMRALLPHAPDSGGDDDPPFVGGAVGYLGYELAEHAEPIELRSLDDRGLPDLCLLICDRVLAFDHATGRGFAAGVGFGATTAAARAAARTSADHAADAAESGASVLTRDGAVRAAEPHGHFDESAYAKAVESALREIEAGNVYQACLTHRLECAFEGDSFALYRRLRRENPAPFASYLELPDVTIVGSSPERFLRLAPDGRVESRPIKGTRPRGATRAEDARLRCELASAAKDRAENLMIVDLVRNDLGRVCRTGSVEVPELMGVEDYASVFQMVSTVTGRLRRDCDRVDLVRAAFPPGSMTGAPKIAAMRILDRLEPVRRGVYSGAIGYFDVRGGMDLSVAIRTILRKDGQAWFHTGGGVVADSDPAAEWRETLDKARPLLASLRPD